MATTTTNYGLKKPAPNDYYNIEDHNGNMDIIDAELKRIENEINNIDVTGTQITVDQSQAPASPGNGTLAQLFSWLANRIKAITGKSNWWEAPDTTLANAKSHIDAAAPHSGHETPAGAQAKVDAHVNATDPHPQYALDSDLSSHTANTTTAHGINTKVSKSGDVMTGILIVPSLRAQINISSSSSPSAWPVGFVAGVVYNNGYPVNYGTIFSYKGTSGNSCVQILQAWPDTDGGEAYLYIRSSRDSGADVFGPWRKVWSENNDGAGSGLDADTVDGKHASDFQVSATAKISGSVTYTDSVPAGGTLSKTIALGGSYKQGRAIFNNDLLVEFTTNNLKSFMYGDTRFNIDSSTHYYKNRYYTREQLGSITKENTGSSPTYNSGGFGAGATGVSDTRMVYIQECYISGTNLVITFKNLYSGSAYELNCTIYWEVW